MPSGGWPRRRRPSPFILKYTALAYRCGAREESQKKRKSGSFLQNKRCRALWVPALDKETECSPVVPRRDPILWLPGHAAGGPSHGAHPPPSAPEARAGEAGEAGARRAAPGPARSPGSARTKTRSAGARLQHAPVLSSARRASPGGVAEPAPDPHHGSAPR